MHTQGAGLGDGDSAKHQEYANSVKINWDIGGVKLNLLMIISLARLYILTKHTPFILRRSPPQEILLKYQSIIIKHTNMELIQHDSVENLEGTLFAVFFAMIKTLYSNSNVAKPKYPIRFNRVADALAFCELIDDKQIYAGIDREAKINLEISFPGIMYARLLKGPEVISSEEWQRLLDHCSDRHELYKIKLIFNKKSGNLLTSIPEHQKQTLCEALVAHTPPDANIDDMISFLNTQSSGDACLLLSAQLKLFPDRVCQTLLQYGSRSDLTRAVLIQYISAHREICNNISIDAFNTAYTEALNASPAIFRTSRRPENGFVDMCNVIDCAEDKPNSRTAITLLKLWHEQLTQTVIAALMLLLLLRLLIIGIPNRVAVLK